MRIILTLLTLYAVLSLWALACSLGACSAVSHRDKATTDEATDNSPL